MSEPLHCIADALADVTQSAAAAALNSLGLQKDQRQPAKKAPENAAAAAWSPSAVSSDVEWV
ncbi:hypothetical protein ABZV59_09570 [Streptomyces anthocyanicus]|uniref:hypothetical protein n=1 Tax=Streptomyces anthocyanicus TaxID=68174 RepID=UPI0033A173BB